MSATQTANSAFPAYTRFVSQRRGAAPADPPVHVRVGGFPAALPPYAGGVVRQLRLLAPRCTGPMRGARFAVDVDRHVASPVESVEVRVRFGAESVVFYFTGRAIDMSDLRFAVRDRMIAPAADPRAYSLQIRSAASVPPADWLPLCGDAGSDTQHAGASNNMLLATQCHLRVVNCSLAVREPGAGRASPPPTAGAHPAESTDAEPMPRAPAHADDDGSAHEWSAMAPPAAPAAAAFAQSGPPHRKDFLLPKDDASMRELERRPDGEANRDATPDSDYSPAALEADDASLIEDDADPAALDALVLRFRDRLAGYDRARGRFIDETDAEDAVWAAALSHLVALDALVPLTRVPSVAASRAAAPHPLPTITKIEMEIVRPQDTQRVLYTMKRFRSGSHTADDFLRGSVYASTCAHPLPCREEPLPTVDPMTWEAAGHTAARSPAAGNIGDGRPLPMAEW